MEDSTADSILLGAMAAAPVSSRTPLMADEGDDADRERDVGVGGEEDNAARGLLDDRGSPGAGASPSRRPTPAASGGYFVWVLTFTAGISGLLFGCMWLLHQFYFTAYFMAGRVIKRANASSQSPDDTGIISATLVSLGTSLSSSSPHPSPPTALDLSLITSSTSLAALVASPLASLLADAHGRRAVVLGADLLFAAGAAAQAGARSVAGMVAGRAVVGLGVGAASVVVPLYVAEMAPRALRGRLVTVNVVCITVGQVVAYLVGWTLADDDGAGAGAGDAKVGGGDRAGWRWMVGLGAVPALLQVVLVLALRLPETPRWLVARGRTAEGRKVLLRVGGGGAEVEDTLRDIEAEVREEADEALRIRTRRAAVARRRERASPEPGAGRSGGSSGDGSAHAGGGKAASSWRAHASAGLQQFAELFASGRNRRALAIAALLQGLQQLCGFNSLMYFSAAIFAMLGFDSPTLTALVVAATNLAFTVVALLLIDRVGRRRILLASLPFMVLGLLAAAWGFGRMTLRGIVPGDEATPPPPSSPTPQPSQRGAAVLVLCSIALYVAAYALGLGNVPWLQSELFALGVRSAGSGVATATNWSANFVVGLTFLPLMQLMGPPATFALYAAVCVVGWVVVWRIYPETAGLSLEEAGRLLETGWGVGRR